MTPIQQLMLGVGAKKKTYVDDVFSNYLYTGNASDKTITNNINFDKGGLVWIKNREQNNTDHALVDTVRGASQYLSSNSSAANVATGANNNFNSFTSTGFTLKDDNGNDFFNKNNTDYSSWSFRKAPGFFDVITWTGNGTNGRQISHGLGSVPGCIMVKRTDADGDDWVVYHRGNADTSNAGNYWLKLNGTDDKGNSDRFYDLEPTATYFTVSDHETVNTNTYEYVAYLFAGGESTAATATSVEFDGSNDDLTIPSSTDFDFGSGDFTIECWIKPDVVTAQGVINRSVGGASSNSSWIVYIDSGNFDFYWVDSSAPNTWSGPISGTSTLPTNQWSHIAVAREGTKLRLFVNGILDNTNDVSFTIPTSTRDVEIGSQNGNSFYDGHISNVRIVKGTAVYTSSFRPPTEPLSNITNTKLLCCQGSTATSATVIPSGSITNDGATHSSDSPFDDPAAFTFGENGDQGIIKCGVSTAGSGGTVTAEQIGWEPQWLLQKQVNGGGSWFINDSMMGWDHTGFNYLRAESTNAEANQSGDVGYPTSKGFDFPGSWWSENNQFIWIAIRRPDGYVGKPAELGTDVFAMDTGNGEQTIPNFDSGFPVDFQFHKAPGTNDNILVTSRLTGTKYVRTDTNDSESNWQNFVFDSNVGWAKGGYSSSVQSWMWKRHAGFDVVTWKGDGVTTGRDIPHSLNAIPEMIWVKKRNSSTYTDWIVYHVGVGNTKYLRLSQDIAPATTINTWNNTTPTATHFTIGQSPEANNNNDNFIGMLFSSVDGISKVGSFNGSSSNVTITTGFSPRFILIKRIDNTGSWQIFDTIRGLNDDNAADAIMPLDLTTASAGGTDYIATSSTGFTVNTASADLNANGGQHLYYAHA